MKLDDMFCQFAAEATTRCNEDVPRQVEEKIRESLRQAEIPITDLHLIGSQAKHLSIGSTAIFDEFILVERTYLESKEKELFDDISRALTSSDYGKKSTLRVKLGTGSASIRTWIGCRQIGTGGYLLLSQDGNRIATDPLRHTSLLNEQDERHAGRLKTLIKIIKAWNINCGSPFAPFYLERLAALIFEEEVIGDLAAALNSFFNFGLGLDLVTCPLPDPCNRLNILTPLKDGEANVEIAIAHLERAFRRSELALEYAAIDRIDSAVGEMRRVVGQKFPEPEWDRENLRFSEALKRLAKLQRDKDLMSSVSKSSK